jgi:transcriptional regulator with XRE-family HTH domain
MAKKAASDNPMRLLRKKLGMNQVEFWARVGVTQSGGSRYETGRNLSRPIELLVALVYGKNGESLLTKLRRNGRA